MKQGDKNNIQQDLEARLSQSKEISSDFYCFCGGGISHNEDPLFSKVYCCLILNYPTPIEIWIWKLVVRALLGSVFKGRKINMKFLFKLFEQNTILTGTT